MSASLLQMDSDSLSITHHKEHDIVCDLILDTTDTTPCAAATPNQVIINLSTQLSIPDYSLFYHAPIESFSPSFSALPDGSLVASPFLLDIRISNMDLLMIGVMLTLFCRNTVVSIDYIRRGRVRYKALFYVLLASQILGLLCFLARLVPFFKANTNCFIVNVLATVSTTLSSSLLITNILGVKAYRCLGDSKFVLVTIFLLQIGSWVLVSLDLPNFHSLPRLSGSCRAQGPMRFIPWAFVVTFIESVFIFICFVFAVWRSYKSPPAVPNRLSIAASSRLSNNNPSDEVTNVEQIGPEVLPMRPRGWWDYVPEPQQEPENDNNSIISDASQENTLFKFIGKIIHQNHSKSLAAGIPNSNADSNEGHEQTTTLTDNEKDSVSPMRSIASRLRGYIMRLLLFQRMCKTELGHITLITLNHVIFAIFALIGGFDDELKFSQFYFININWAALSLLVIHSFERVVIRNEREALFQQPYEWNPAFQGGSGLPSPISIRPLRRIYRVPVPPLGQLAPGDEDSGPTSPNQEQPGFLSLQTK